MSPVPPAPVELSAGELRWRVQLAGRAAADAPALLLLHGTGSSLLSWRACLPGLAPHFHLVIPDLPGHGGTGAFADRQASLPRMAAALADLLDRLDCRPTLMAGHSAGAALMAQLALDGRTPGLRGLLAVNGALAPLEGVFGLVAPAAAQLAARSRWFTGWVTRHAAQPGALNHLIASTGSRLDDAGTAHYRQLLQQPDHVRGVLDMLAGWRLEALQARLPELRVPLWLVAGLADRTVAPVRSVELARRLPRARFVPLPGRGHLAHEEDPAAINQWLLALLAETVPQAGGAAAPDTAA